MTAAFRIHPADNVATLLDDAEGTAELRGEGSGSVALRQRIALGHKVALADIAAGQAVVKFGIAIGRAAVPIVRGDWVHLHNCLSGFDERSGGFDLATGEAGDVRYD